MWNETVIIYLKLKKFFTQERFEVIPLKGVLPDIFCQMIGIFLRRFRNGFSPVGSRNTFNCNGFTD